MKRFLIVFSLLSCLVGCSSRSENFEVSINEIVDENLNGEFMQANHSKKYLKYYVPKNIGVMQQESTSTVFNYENAQFLMSINVASIVSNGQFSYKSPLDLSQAIYVKEGTFENKNQETLDYTLSLIPLVDNYYIVLNSNYLSFYGYSNLIDSIEIINAMTKILKSSVVVKDEIILNFDREESKKSEKIILDIFNEIVPNSGRLEDIVDGEISSTVEPTTPTETIDPSSPPPVNEESSEEDIYQESGDLGDFNEKTSE